MISGLPLPLSALGPVPLRRGRFAGVLDSALIGAAAAFETAENASSVLEKQLVQAVKMFEILPRRRPFDLPLGAPTVAYLFADDTCDRAAAARHPPTVPAADRRLPPVSAIVGWRDHVELLRVLTASRGM